MKKILQKTIIFLFTLLLPLCTCSYGIEKIMGGAVILPSFLLTITKSGTGTGTVTSVPAGIDCGLTCSAVYTAGTTVVLTAVADPGSVFTGWTGAGCGGIGVCTVIMNNNYTVDAAFTSSTKSYTYAYYGWGLQAQRMKLSDSTLTTVAIPGANVAIYNVAIDLVRRKLIYAKDTSPVTLYFFNLDTFTYSSTLSLAGASNIVLNGMIVDETNGFLYASVLTLTGASVIRVNTFTEAYAGQVDYILAAPPAGDGYGQSGDRLGLAQDATNIYLGVFTFGGLPGCAANNMGIGTINKATFTKSGFSCLSAAVAAWYLRLASDIYNNNTMLIPVVRNTGATYRLVGVNYPALTFIGGGPGWVGGPGVSNTYSGASTIDNNGKFYFIENGTNPATVVRYDIPTLTRESTIQLNPGESFSYGVYYDLSRDRLMVSTQGLPGFALFSTNPFARIGQFVSTITTTAFVVD